MYAEIGPPAPVPGHGSTGAICTAQVADRCQWARVAAAAFPCGGRPDSRPSGELREHRGLMTPGTAENHRVPRDLENQYSSSLNTSFSEIIWHPATDKQSYHYTVERLCSHANGGSKIAVS